MAQHGHQLKCGPQDFFVIGIKAVSGKIAIKPMPIKAAGKAADISFFLENLEWDALF
jgi:hypothetical protein